MKLGFKGLTLGSVLAVASAMNIAQANPMDFETVTVNGPVGTAYAGFSFTGDNVVKDTFTVFPADPANLQWVVSANGFTIDVIDPSLTPLNSLSFDYAGGLLVFIYDTNGVKTSLTIDQAAFPDWYAQSPVLLDKSTRIDYVEFARNPVAGGQFAVDNISFGLQPIPVPEPSGFALAALGLVAVAAMTRRRQR